MRKIVLVILVLLIPTVVSAIPKAVEIAGEAVIIAGEAWNIDEEAGASLPWQLISGSVADCPSCGVLYKTLDGVIFRIKLISDGTTATLAESFVIPAISYSGYFLYDVTIETPASGGPGDAWNIKIYDTLTGKLVIDQDAISNTAGSVIPINGNDKTGKYEQIFGQLQIVVDDTDMADTEYVYATITLVGRK